MWGEAHGEMETPGSEDPGATACRAGTAANLVGVFRPRREPRSTNLTRDQPPASAARTGDFAQRGGPHLPVHDGSRGRDTLADVILEPQPAGRVYQSDC